MFGLTYKGRVEGAHTFVVTDPTWGEYWCSDCVAFTWGRLIVYRSPRHFQDLAIRAHEATHVQQSRRIGLLLYPLLYWYYGKRRGYYLNPFEVEARIESVKRVHRSVVRLRAAGLRVQVRPSRAKQKTKKKNAKMNKGEQGRSKERRVRKVIRFA